ncbi:hypothetical protein QVD17_22564 [Tagetes erecta]|uniref:Uncharacterized protein n=1 Tax=Tagetes erecta TaxID=13708 RepID=A0AAD8KD41_TARER|nr:hypothetical protein QVD17_22564 [Tagetes erecta]
MKYHMLDYLSVYTKFLVCSLKDRTRSYKSPLLLFMDQSPLSVHSLHGCTRRKIINSTHHLRRTFLRPPSAQLINKCTSL